MASKLDRPVAETSLGDLAEAITTSVLRAVGARDDFKRRFGSDDSFVVWEPMIRYGGRFILGRGQIPEILGQGGMIDGR